MESWKILSNINSWQCDWSDLPTDILETISLKLSVFDMLSFMGVCTSWRVSGKKISRGKIYSLLVFHAEPQLEVIKRSKVNGDNAYCFNLCVHDRLVRQYLRHHKSKVGWHPDGWLLLLDETFHNVFLIKLLPHTRIQLPQADDYDRVYSGIIIKPVLYANNPSSCYQEKLIVIIRYGWGYWKLAFRRHGDHRWTSLGKGYADMTSHNNTLYALKIHGRSNTAMIEGWDFVGSCLPEKKYMIQVPYNVSKFLDWEWSCYTRLEISPITNEILIVAPKRRFHGDFPKWFVFKVDISLRQCIPVNSLYGSSLLLGSNCSMFVSSNDVERYGYKPNSVYYLDYDFDLSKDGIDIILSSYGLEDGQIQQISGPLREFGQCRFCFVSYFLQSKTIDI